MKKVSFTILLVFAVLAQPWQILRAQAPQSSDALAFRDTTLTDAQRIDDLLSRLTIDEKIHLLSTDLGVERLGIPRCDHFEGLHGLALGGPGMWGGRQQLSSGEVVGVEYPTTIFPQSYGIGSSWDVDLVGRIGRQEAIEARYYMHRTDEHHHALVMRAPNADLARDPRWGRTEESFGEDPYLCGQMTVAMVKALQGDHPRYWRTASLMKHFLANSNEDGRDSTSSDFSRRLFHEYYSVPFRKGIQEGGSRAFMASYNAWNGTVMSVNPVLKSIARDRWGQCGIICTDGGALGLLVNAHHAYPTLTEGAAAVVKATVGQFLDRYQPSVREALEKGLLTEADIDEAIRGNLYVALKLGLLDADPTANLYAKAAQCDPPYLTDEAKALAREAMDRSIVLLKNEAAEFASAPLLPLDASRLRRIAVIGQYANRIVQDWYSGKPPYEVTILDGIRQAVGPDVEVTYTEDNRMGEAETAAAQADVAIVCVGNHPYGTDARWKVNPVPSDGREAVDREALTLPHEDLVKLVRKANPNTVLVLVSSFPYAINWSQAHVPAILQATHCCQEQGNGVADVLFGRVNPAGRTVQTWVSDITELPPMMDYDIRHGRTYMYYQGEPLYPFGYGLSYTTFRYGKPKLLSRPTDDTLRVSVTVKNVGPRDGDEVVQLYVRYLDSAVDRPRQQLCAFRRVAIAAGQSEQVTLTVPRSELAYFDEDSDEFVDEKGRVELCVGASSADLRGTVVCKLE
jgi:beta-glucosidase